MLIVLGISFGVWSILIFNEVKSFPISTLVIGVGATILGVILLLASVVLYSNNKVQTEN